MSTQASSSDTAIKKPPAPILVSVITGFLGAGKTTLLNTLLKSPQLHDTLVIINEFGEIGLDHLLVERVDDGVIQLSAGCLCCTIRGDLISTMEDMLRKLDNGRIKPFRRVIIETTGLADPAPILHTLMYHPYLMLRYRLDGVISVVDAINGMSTLDRHKEAVKQAAVADRLILTKTDLAITPEQQQAVKKLKTRLKKLNPSAHLIEAQASTIAAQTVMETGLWSLDDKTAHIARWLRMEEMEENQRATEAEDCTICATGDVKHHHTHDINRHDDHIRAFCIAEDHAMPLAMLDMFLDLLRSAHGPDLLRVKGIIKIKEHPEKPVVIHAVQHVFHPPLFLEAWPDGDQRTKLVFIVKDMSEESVRALYEAFVGVPRIGQADGRALAQNPLALP